MRQNADLISSVCQPPPFIIERQVPASTHESNQSMDHLPHPFFGQSKTTHHQPHFHRRPRPSALRAQGRLSGRVLRWCSPHRPSPDLRGYLRPLARRRISRAASNSATRISAAAGNTAAPNRDPLSASGSQVSSTRPRISQLRLQPSLSLRLTRARFAWKGLVRITSPLRRFSQTEWFGKGTTSVVPSAPAKESALAAEVNTTSFCERSMNPTCGKPIPHPRIKPVIAGDTTCSVSLLTGTISGSNFAIP